MSRWLGKMCFLLANGVLLLLAYVVAIVADLWLLMLRGIPFGIALVVLAVILMGAWLVCCGVQLKEDRAWKVKARRIAWMGWLLMVLGLGVFWSSGWWRYHQALSVFQAAGGTLAPSVTPLPSGSFSASCSSCIGACAGFCRFAGPPAPPSRPSPRPHPIQLPAHQARSGRLPPPSARAGTCHAPAGSANAVSRVLAPPSSKPRKSPIISLNRSPEGRPHAHHFPLHIGHARAPGPR